MLLRAMPRTWNIHFTYGSSPADANALMRVSQKP
jgi:hypothetical protein